MWFWNLIPLTFANVRDRIRFQRNRCDCSRGQELLSDAAFEGVFYAGRV